MKPLFLRLLFPFMAVLGVIFFAPQPYAFNLMTNDQIEALYQDCLERVNMVENSENQTPDDQINLQVANEDCNKIRQAYYADRDGSAAKQEVHQDILRAIFEPLATRNSANFDQEPPVDEYCNTYSNHYPTLEPNKTFSPGQIREHCMQNLRSVGNEPAKRLAPTNFYNNQQAVEFYTTCTETASAYVEEVATTMTEDEKYAYLKNAYTNCQCYYEFFLAGGDLSDKDLSRPLRDQILPMVDFTLPDICYLGKYQVVSGGNGPEITAPPINGSSASSGGGSGFNSIDIGPDVNSGNTTFQNGTFNITVASGALGAQLDDFRFVYTQVSGDVTVTARVVSISSSNRWARAGVHIRDNMNEDSMNASMFITPQKRLAQYRPTNGGTTQYFSDDDSPIKWLRLQRVGNTVNAYYSSDGSSFTLYRSFNISFGNNVYVGLAVTSDDPSTPSTATIDNVTVTSP